MTRISIGIDFCTTGATVTGTGAGAATPAAPGRRRGIRRLAARAGDQHQGTEGDKKAEEQGM